MNNQICRSVKIVIYSRRKEKEKSESIIRGMEDMRAYLTFKIKVIILK